MMAHAHLRFSSVVTGLRPPFWPRAVAAASPARVRSWIRSRSNCAQGAEQMKDQAAAGVVVSIASVIEWNLPRTERAALECLLPGKS